MRFLSMLNRLLPGDISGVPDQLAGNRVGTGMGIYLSPAPQALPQAEGFSSFFSSPAPQAEPQAEDFSSFLSPVVPQELLAPQAEPQAEAAFSSFHSARFASAILCTSVGLFRAISAL